MQQSDNVTHSRRTYVVRTSGREMLLGLAGLSRKLYTLPVAPLAHLHFN
jgi:hypothetical protein